MAKLLLVEDDNNLREIYAARLEAEGFVIATAADGESALATAVKEKPDLIILDVMMPKISGFDVLDILRSTPETKDAKIVMMTALSQASDRERGEQLGADKYLVKSQVTLEDVVVNINELLEQKTPAPTVASTTPEEAPINVPDLPIANVDPANTPQPTPAPDQPPSEPAQATTTAPQATDQPNSTDDPIVTSADEPATSVALPTSPATSDDELPIQHTPGSIIEPSKSE